MKLGILSDIHANIWALEAVLADARQRGVEQFVNLGDILYGPLQPRQTYELLQTIDAVTIRGNEDRILYEPTPPTPTLEFVVRELKAESMDWLKSLPQTVWVTSEIFACHGTPTSDTVYWLEDVSAGEPQVRAEAAILQYLDQAPEITKAKVLLCGHSHIPRLVQLDSGQLVLNPGSVGVPAYDDDNPVYHKMQNYSPYASYAVLDATKRQVDLLKVPYDYPQAAAQAARLGRDDWAKWIATGRV